MEVDTLAIPKEEAEEEFQALKQAFKSNVKLRREEIRQDLYKVYKHLRHGKKIIDVFLAFQKIGVNENRNPKLAICRADAKKCYCHKENNGSAVFSFQSSVSVVRKTQGDVGFPEGTFQFVADPEDQITWMQWREKNIETLVPIIPAKILVKEVKILLPNYHILWEVEPGAWKKSRPPKDPILLKRLTPNLFGVLATWNLTKLERAVIRGRILSE